MNKIVLSTLVAIFSASPLAAAWEHKETIDPMTDARRGLAIMQVPDFGIAVKCDKPGTGSMYLHFVTREYLGEGRQPVRSVKYRIDDGTPAEVSARFGKNGFYIINIAPKTPGSVFFDAIRSGKKLVIQFSDYDFKTYTQIIDISGSQDAITRVATTCADANYMN